jgi:hypothetical protein
MLTIEIKRTYSDRSVTRGILIVDGTPIGVTMEAPRRVGMMGKCLPPGEYSAKLVCTEYSPYTVKIIVRGSVYNNYLIPRTEYESLNRGICIGKPIDRGLYSLKESDKVFNRLVQKIQQHICKGDRKIKVVIYEDPLLEEVEQFRDNPDEFEEDFFEEGVWE